jgi:hypothetical protein
MPIFLRTLSELVGITLVQSTRLPTSLPITAKRSQALTKAELQSSVLEAKLDHV